ncbi:hypothetical protein H257_07635 [Aphanomyces astaci]|uniref:Uncharacterized protein n=1 Tax=Aphanomyces astaci TaxID=112090 RepID=W4GHN6_APHAT|nr:hypothetical protein H257_07635 [Aphanomyces astaci]ETV78806.1 hypothetical protein H257_07635 [Aphanomyces astaci]RQM22918.1 hypothetical protein B5M09_004799 [Aphanomyces astaci]|eukprot:XP_009831525.1 hypothetical protein H257_07635 [Aphanomyces astaci]
MQLAQAQADSGHYNQGQVVLDVVMQALLHGLAECKVTMSGASAYHATGHALLKQKTQSHYTQPATHIDEADASSQNNSAKRNMLKLAL